MKVSIIAAISADGYIAQSNDQLADWTSKEDKQFFVQQTKESGVMIMGNNTFRTLGRGLPGRKTIVFTRDPNSHNQVEGDVEFTNQSPQAIISRLAKDGYEAVAVCGGAQIYGMFLRENLVTDIYLTIEPVFFGQGTPLSIDATYMKLTLVTTTMLNDNTILLHYKTNK